MNHRLVRPVMVAPLEVIISNKTEPAKKPLVPYFWHCKGDTYAEFLVGITIRKTLGCSNKMMSFAFIAILLHLITGAYLLHIVIVMEICRLVWRGFRALYCPQRPIQENSIQVFIDGKRVY
jgi:hypothetical protein